MGACFVTYTFENKKSEKTLLKEWAELQRRAECEAEADWDMDYPDEEYYPGYNGTISTLDSGIRFHNREFKTYNEAQDFLSEKSEKRGQAQACKYKDGRKKFWMVGGSCAE